MARGRLWFDCLQLACALGAVLCFSGIPLARADVGEKPLVVIVDADESSITRRLRQEIEALGFSVEVRTQRLDAARAVAVIEVRAARPGSVQLSMVDAKTAKVVRQALPIEAAQDPNSAELVATRTVELLRAARLTVQTQVEVEPPRPEPSQPMRVVPPAAPVAPRPAQGSELLVGAGLGLSFSPGWTLGSDVSLSAAWLSAGRLGLLAELTLPIASCRWHGPDGDIDALANRYRLGAVFEAFRERPVAVRFGLGAELEQLSFRGRAESPYVNAESHLLALAPWTRVAVSVRVAPSLRLATAFTGAFTVPRSVVNFAGREVSTWGRPGLTAALGAEWSFP